MTSTITKDFGAKSIVSRYGTIIVSTQKDYRQGFWLVMIIAVPVMLSMALGMLEIAAYWFWGSFGIITIYYLFSLLRSRQHSCKYFIILIGVLPFIGFFRTYLFYSSVIFMLMIGLFFAFNTFEWRELLSHSRKKKQGLIFILVFIGIYYLFSFFFTGDYSINLRGLEFSLTMLLIVLVGSADPKLLSTSFKSLIVSSLALTIGFVPHFGDFGRLGFILIEETSSRIGHNSSLGSYLSFIFLGTIFDNGKWFNLDKNRKLRILVAASSFIFLLMTTSRQGWLMIALGIFSVLFLAKGKKNAIISILIIAFSIILVNTKSQYGDQVKHFFYKMIDPERTIYDRSGSRLAMWKVIGTGLLNEPSRIMWGFGPGEGKSLYGRFAPLVSIRRLSLENPSIHGYFLQLISELGLLGLLPFIIWFIRMFLRSLIGARKFRVVFPLTCIAAYLGTIMVVSGYSPQSGLLVGVVALGVDFVSKQDQ